MDGGVNIFPVITHIDDVLPHVAGRAMVGIFVAGVLLGWLV